MTFSEFIQKLYPYCGNGETQPQFLLTLLTNITNEQADPIFDKEDSDLRKIFSGTRNLPKKSASYFLTHLDKGKFDTYLYDLLSEDALTELCNEFESSIGNATKDDITTKLSDYFSSILKNIAYKGMELPSISRIEISNFEIERELSEIVKTLATSPLEQLKIELTYEPVNVDRKILSNGALKDDIRKYVIDYYLFVEGLFKDASKQNSAFFDMIAEQVKYHSDNFIEQNLPQEVVFDNMVNWLKAKVTYVSYTACRIIISFFVQNCEVFHAITE